MSLPNAATLGVIEDAPQQKGAEPLNPEAVTWGEEAFGLPFHDN
jgi:hypothetical protein